MSDHQFHFTFAQYLVKNIFSLTSLRYINFLVYFQNVLIRTLIRVSSVAPVMASIPHVREKTCFIFSFIKYSNLIGQSLQLNEYSTVYSVKSLFWLAVFLAGSFSEQNRFNHFFFIYFSFVKFNANCLMSRDKHNKTQFKIKRINIIIVRSVFVDFCHFWKCLFLLALFLATIFERCLLAHQE